MIRLLNLGPAKHEKVAIYVVNQADFECLQSCGSCFAAEQFVGISWGTKIPFALNNIIIIIIDKKPDIVKQIREF